MPEAETLAVGNRRSDRAPAPWLFLIIGVLLGALLGAMAAFVVIQAQRPDRAAEFMIDQRLKAYQAYADEVATANVLEDQAMAAVVPDLDAEDGEGPDPTGAKPECPGPGASSAGRSDVGRRPARQRARARGVSRQPRRAGRGPGGRALADDGDDAPTTDDYDAVQTKILGVRGKQAPATLVIRDELAAGQ
ncbi:MAG TPA: hypothetical protein VIT65_04265 [Microlunatus sp.]